MESVRLGFIMAHVNNLIVCAGDVSQAFLYGKTCKKVYVIMGPEFGPELEGKQMTVYKALYGLKSSSARYHEHMSVKLRSMGFKPSKADPDLYIKHLPDRSYEYIV